MPGETILVVDDNALNLKLARMLLVSKGYTIQTAENGLEALTLAEEIHPDLILLDIQLPGIDGLEVARRLKSNRSTADIPVVALTAYAMQGDEQKARAAGCDGYITKPIDTTNLPAQVRSYLDAAAKNSGPKSVLIVDDDPVQLKLQCLAFERAGYNVASADDGASALEKAAHARVDVIVSDVLMPRIDGFRLCQAVRTDSRLARVPIVLVTSGSVLPSDEDLARSIGANAIVVRTAEMKNVLQAVSQALAEGPVSASEINPAELAAICEEFLAEGVHQSKRLVEQVSSAAGLNVPAARRLTHRWAGTGGTLGFPQISQSAFEIERLLEKDGGRASDLDRRLLQLADLFQRAIEGFRGLTVPGWIAGSLKDRRIGLIGFPRSDHSKILDVLKAAGATVVTVADDELPKSEACELWVVKFPSRDRLAPIAANTRMLFAGGADILREEPFNAGITHDLLVEPWTPEEVVTRCQRLLAAAVPAAHKPKANAGKPAQILIADDDPTIVAIVRSTFESHGMKCNTTHQGGDVISAAEKLPPDVIVLDVNLPQMDGFQVLSMIRNHESLRRCFVVMLTARQQETDIMKGFGLGADDYIVKPFSPMELVARVRRLLRERAGA
jgi:CheY-like chemotaxis protein